MSPKCDCGNHSDVPIVPHLGVFASTDAVAIDMACVDKAKESPGMPGSAVEMMEAHHPGDNKFEAAAATFHGQSEVASINTGHEIGLGSRDYTLIEVEPQSAEQHKFPYDRRPSRQRFKERFEKFQPFPYDRHDGKGFARNDVVDFDRVKRHYDHSTNGHHQEVEIRELQPADDDE